MKGKQLQHISLKNVDSKFLNKYLLTKKQRVKNNTP